PAYITESKKQIETLKKSLVALTVKTNVPGAEIVVNGEVLRSGGKTVKTPYEGIIWLKPGFSALVFTKKGYVNKELLIDKAKSGAVITKQVKLLTPKQMIEKSKIYMASQKAKQEQEQQRLILFRKYQLQRSEMEYKAKIRKKSMRFFGYATIGGGVALLAVGGLLGWSSQSTADRMEERAKSGVDWTSIKADYDRFERQRNICFFVTGIGTTVLLGGLLITYFGFLEPTVKTKTPFDYLFSSSLFKRKVRVSPILGTNSLGLNLEMPF
ncbi:hypothetical protein KJ865_13955, partial [Myxococcota bacterium]|nr:hypothetical protein [Myxococcota bacterium]